MKMRVLETELFSFAELSPEAQDRAIEDYRNDLDSSSEIAWQSEIFDSFKAVYKHAGITLKDYSLGLHCHSYVRIDIDDNVKMLSGARALAWLENNFLYQFRVTRSEYLKNRKHYFSYGYRVGKIKDCPMTGICFDEDYIYTLINSIKSGDSLGDCFKYRMPETYCKLLEAEYEYERSDENIREQLACNDYEFLENGKLYR